MTMRKEDWVKFFTLIDQIVHDGRPQTEKAAEVRKWADATGTETNFREFLSWFEDEMMDNIVDDVLN